MLEQRGAESVFDFRERGERFREIGPTLAYGEGVAAPEELSLAALEAGEIGIVRLEEGGVVEGALGAELQGEVDQMAACLQ